MASEPLKQTVAPRELYGRLVRGKDFDILDVRTPGEYEAGHVPGAKLLPLDDLVAADYLRARGESDRPIYVLCQTGARARRAVDKFEQAGFGGCILVEGGTAAWVEAKLPVNKGASHGPGKPAAIPLMRQVQLVVGFVSAAGAALALTLNPWFALIPLAMGLGLFIAGLTGFCGLALVLAKMPWNRLGGRSKPGHKSSAVRS